VNITPSFDGISTSLCLWKSIRWSIRQSVSPLLSSPLLSSQTCLPLSLRTSIILQQRLLRAFHYALQDMQSWNGISCKAHTLVSLVCLWLRRRNLVVATSCSHNLLSCLASIIFELLQGLLNWQSSQYNVNDRS
jgi:hypothetical protein